MSTCVVDMVAVMGDVFASVYNLRMLLSLKVKLSVQWGWLWYNLGLYLLVCWSDGYFLLCYVSLRFSSLLVGICCFSVVVWRVSAAGAVLACPGGFRYAVEQLSVPCSKRTQELAAAKRHDMSTGAVASRFLLVCEERSHVEKQASCTAIERQYRRMRRHILCVNKSQLRRLHAFLFTQMLHVKLKHK
jgi:hypothetical protein